MQTQTGCLCRDLQLDQSAVLAGLRPTEDSAHFAAPSAGAAAVVDLAGMAAQGLESPAAVDADAMSADGASSDEEAGPAGGDEMDEADGPQPAVGGKQQQSRWVAHARALQVLSLGLVDDVGS